MKIMKPFTLVVLSAGLLLAGAPEGKELYTSKCANCHGANGEGKAAIGKMFNVTMPVLASKEVQDKSDAGLKKVILTGKGIPGCVAYFRDSICRAVSAACRTTVSGKPATGRVKRCTSSRSAGWPTM